MSTVMKASEFVKKAIDIAENYKTLYVMGCFGAPMNAKNKKRYTTNENEYNQDPSRVAMINAASDDTFGFDCVCLFKGILWGWIGDKNHVYGGARYKSNGVPEMGANQMITICEKVSTNFSNVKVGEILWCKGHVGVYIGDGLAVECTPRWENCVQITAVKNIGTKSGYHARTWTKHGFLPYIEYDVSSEKEQKPAQTSTKLKYEVGKIVKFSGTKQYASANASVGVAAKAGRAKITAVSANGKHPYHIRSINSSGNFVSGVYGWVDVNAISGITAIKVKSAKSFDNALSGKYKVNASNGLNIRSGASKDTSSLGVLKNGAIVNNYGYYTINSDGEKWLYIKSKEGLTGFCHSGFLKKC